MKFHVLRENGAWVWNLRDDLGEVMAKSHGYERRNPCMDSVLQVKEGAATADVVMEEPEETILISLREDREGQWNRPNPLD